ncbi:MAG: hypothetical protein V2A73_15895 [Pseudomonadota bacterium]
MAASGKYPFESVLRARCQQEEELARQLATAETNTARAEGVLVAARARAHELLARRQKLARSLVELAEEGNAKVGALAQRHSFIERLQQEEIAAHGAIVEAQRSKERAEKDEAAVRGALVRAAQNRESIARDKARWQREQQRRVERFAEAAADDSNANRSSR